jgi:putative glutamine amidotransferase
MTADGLPLIGLTTYNWPADFSGQPSDLIGLTYPYIRAVRAAGGVPVLLPHGARAQELETVVARLDGLVLPGGEDVDPAEYGQDQIPECGRIDRDRDALELQLARQAAEGGLPVLAVCRGHQVLNVALGGTLWQDLKAQLPAAQEHACAYLEDAGTLAHQVRVMQNSRLVDILGTEQIGTNSSHHQAIRTLGAGLVATAWAPDDVIEGIELRGHPFAVGVQWHPERMYREHPRMLRLFEVLVEAARARSAARLLRSEGSN